MCASVKNKLINRLCGRELDMLAVGFMIVILGWWI